MRLLQFAAADVQAGAALYTVVEFNPQKCIVRDDQTERREGRPRRATYLNKKYLTSQKCFSAPSFS